MLFLLASVTLIFLLCVYITRRKLTTFEEFPQPSANFLFGHILQIRSLTGVLDAFSGYITEVNSKSFKLIFGPKIFPLKQGFGTTDYKLIERILNSTQILTKAENYKFLRPWLRNGLLISDGDYWRRHRKILTPAFHFAILKDFVEVFDRVGDVFIRKLERYHAVPSIDLTPLVTLCTLDIICETAMGTKIDAQGGKNIKYVNSVIEVGQIVCRRCIHPLKVFDLSFMLTRDYYRQKKALKILHSFTLNVINSRKNRRIGATNKKKAFLDLLLTSSAGLTDQEICEEVDTFMFEGHDTTSSAICYALFCLADHPEEKILNEHKNLFGEELNPVLTYADLQNMKYLECVIKETLRLYPSVPILGRYTFEDIHFGNNLIAKNSNIGLLVYQLHRDPKYFPEPEKFKPERFESFDSSSPFCYIPFSAGPRNCIGQKFAMLELKTIISKVVRNFEIIPAKSKHILELSVEPVLKSPNGVKVGLKIRNNA